MDDNEYIAKGIKSSRRKTIEHDTVIDLSIYPRSLTILIKR
jgi:hypothetical protein